MSTFLSIVQSKSICFLLDTLSEMIEIEAYEGLYGQMDAGIKKKGASLIIKS